MCLCKLNGNISNRTLKPKIRYVQLFLHSILRPITNYFYFDPRLTLYVHAPMTYVSRVADAVWHMCLWGGTILRAGGALHPVFKPITTYNHEEATDFMNSHPNAQSHNLVEDKA
jgi:hypothetical protein